MSIDENWRYNVSKKIAQLTKVIFRLHSESLDRHDLIARVKKKCDDEIASVVLKSSEVIGEAQKGASDYRENLEKLLRAEYDSKFEQVKTDFNLYKEKLQGDVENISLRAEEQIKDLKTQLHELEEKADKTQWEFRKASEELSLRHEDVLKKVEEKHQREIETCVQQSNERINKMVADQAKKEEEIRIQMQKELVEQKRAANSDSNMLRDQLKKKIFELENGNRSLEGQIKKNGITINNLKLKLDKAEKQIEDLNNKNKISLNLLKQEHELNLKNLEDKFREDLKGKDREINDLKEKIEANTIESSKNNEDRENEHKEQIQHFLHKIEEMKHELEKNSGYNEQMHQELLEQHQKEIEQIEQKFKEEINVLQGKENLMQNEITKIQNSHKAEIVDLKKSYEIEIAKFRNEINKMKHDHFDEINHLRKRHENELEDLKVNMMNSNKTNEELITSTSSELSRLKDTLSQMRSDHELQIQDMQSRKAFEINNIHAMHKKEMEAIVKSYDHKQKLLEEQTKSQIQHLIDDYEVQLKQVNEKNELNLRLSIEKQNSEIEKKTNAQLTMMRDEIDDEINGYRRDIEAKKKEIEKLTAELETVTVTKNDMIAQLKEEIEQIKKDAEDEKREIIKSSESQINHLKNEISQKTSSSETEMSNLSIKFETKLKLANQKLVELDSQRIAQLSQLKVEFEDKKEQYEKLIEELREEIKSLMKRHQEEIQEFEKKIQEIEDEYKKSIDALSEKHKDELDNKEKKHKEEIKKINEDIEDYKEQLRVSKDMYQNLLDEMERFANNSKRDEFKRITELEKRKMADLKEQEAQFQNKINILNSKIKELTDENTRIIDQNNLRFVELQEKSLNEMEQVRLNYENQIVHQKREHDKSIDQLNQHIAELEVSIEEWENKYNTRDARPEDLEKIQMLEERVKERSDTLEKLFNELKHYQNELVNRELSYNKLFNVNPNIGELNVIERKIKKENLVTETKTINFLPRISASEMRRSLKNQTPRRPISLSKKTHDWSQSGRVKSSLRQSTPS